MKKSIISMILIFTIFVSFTSTVFAVNNDYEYLGTMPKQNTVNLLNKVTTLGDVINEMQETSEAYVYELEDTKMTIPKIGGDDIETTFDSNNTLVSMKLPKEVSFSKAQYTSNGTIVYNSESKNIDILVQMLEDEDNGLIYSSVRALILIKDDTASKRYDFAFSLPKGGRLITSEDYKKIYYANDNDWIGDNLIFVIDNQGEIVSTIDEAWAVDAKNKKVDTYYEINGNVLTQIVKFDETNTFPIIADPTNTGVKTKVETLAFKNTRENIEKLIKARNDINNRQNSSLKKVISLINSVFGLFNIGTGIMSMIISGVMGSNASFLEKCEDTYSGIQEGFTLKTYNSAEIYFTYRGTYQGQNKGYVYKIQSVTNNRITVK